MSGKELARKVLENIGNVIVGKEETAKLLLTAVLADGHVLLEDVPRYKQYQVDCLIG